MLSKYFLQEGVLFSINGFQYFYLVDNGKIDFLAKKIPFISDQFKDIDDFHFMFVLVRFDNILKSIDYREDDLKKMKDSFDFRLFGLDFDKHCVTDIYGTKEKIETLINKKEFYQVVMQTWENEKEKLKTKDYKILYDVVNYNGKMNEI